MPKQDLKRLEQKEKEREKTQEEKDQKLAERAQPTKAEALKKWKGKDWFAILAPKIFGEAFLYETPATDPSQLVGRTLGVRAPQLTNDQSKSHMKLLFKIAEIKEKTASTYFWGLVCSPDYISRNLRAGLQKMEVIDNFQTKDNWELQITISMILNRKSEVNIQKKSRKWVADFLKQEASKSSLDEFVKNIVAGSYQKKLKKDVSHVYPVRFLEIAKIEVVKVGGVEAAAA